MIENNAQNDPTSSAGLKADRGWLSNYLPMGFGQIVSLVGSALVQFALVWYVTKETGSASVLAAATTAALIPRIVVGPFVGALVDRWNRKVVMIVSDLVVALATAILALLFAAGAIRIWHIIAILLVRSLAGVFQGPAITAATTLLVPTEHLTRLGGIHQAVDGLISVFSPALGALLLELLPMQGVLAVDLITAAIAIALLFLFVKVPNPKARAASDKVTPKTLLADVLDAVRFLVNGPGMVLRLIIASLINVVLSPGINLLPLHVSNFFGKGAQELAWVQAAIGVGSIVGGLILGVWGGFRRRVWTVLIGLCGMGIGMVLFGLVPADRFYWSLIMMGLVGLMLSLTNGSLGPLTQTKVPPDVQGRVFMLLGSLSQIMMPIGLFVSAPIADRFGTQITYVIGGVFCFLLGVVGMLDKRLNTLDLQKEGGELMEAEAVEGALKAD